VVVENKPGADGAIGIETVAKSAPDGYTIVQYGSSAVINPALYKKMPFDIVKGFEHITKLYDIVGCWSVNPSLPVRSVKDFIAFAKSKPGQLSYASPNSMHYLVTEMFKLKAGIDMVNIPYKGTSPALQALVASEVQFMSGSMFTMLPQIKAGKLRAIAVLNAKRSPALPDVPTTSESGLPGFEFSAWAGFAAPAGTPKEIVNRLNAEIVRILRMPDVKSRFAAGGYEVVWNTPEEFTSFIKEELKQYNGIVKDAGIARIDG
jgi:tripartite-type tricarboxylate transporter receptor subunit TctC